MTAGATWQVAVPGQLWPVTVDQRRNIGGLAGKMVGLVGSLAGQTHPRRVKCERGCGQWTLTNFWRVAPAPCPIRALVRRMEHPP